MKTLVLLSMCLAALAMPQFSPGVAQNPALTKEDQSPLLGDLVPLQGHVEVENPRPQVRLGSKEQPEKLSPEPVDMKQSQSMEKLDTKVKPPVKVEQEGKVKTEVKTEPEIKVEQEGMVELEVKVKPDVKVEQKLKVEQEVNEWSEVKVEQEGKENPEVKVEKGPEVEPQVKVAPEPEVNLNSDILAKQEVDVKPYTDIEPEDKVDPDFAEESEFKVEPEPEPKESLMFSDVQKKFQVQMKLEPEIETRPEVEEWHIDMERKYKMVDEPIMALEPMAENMFREEERVAVLPEVGESSGVAFQSPYEPEKWKEPFQNPDIQMPDTAIMEEEPALDTMGQQMSPSENYFPNEEAGKGMERQQDFLTEVGSDDLLVKEPRSEFVREAQQGEHSHPCVPFEGKCYWFFNQPKAAADAEVFCQEYFTGGHLASITCPYIHHEMMNMMLRINGAHTRAWVGGLRYLQTGRFVWLDGSRWGYDDWLYGEPNNTANKEDCVEVLANGKFNDFTCWEPQVFFCSSPLN